MIHSLTAYTYEIDNPGQAVADILGQIKRQVEPNERMLGIVLCSFDFIDSGVIKTLSLAAPFPIIGGTTVSQAVQDKADILYLTLMVLYSDDCVFVPAVTEVIQEEGDLTALVTDPYNEAKKTFDGKEKMVFAFSPIKLFHRSGDSYVEALSKVSGNVPVFGMMVVDDSLDYANAYTIFNGEAYEDRLVFALLAGDFNPEFHISELTYKSKLLHKAEVTDAKGSVLLGINDIPIVEYLESIGLASNGRIRDGINSLRFLVYSDKNPDYDGRPVGRAIYQILDDGTAGCGGEIPVGSTITVGVCEKNEVVGTARDLVSSIKQKYSGRTALIFSCTGRRIALGSEPLAEMQHYIELNGDVNYLMAYAGGEICPMSVSNGVASNFFHNYTLVTCIL